MADTPGADLLRLGLLWLESDLPTDVKIFSPAVKIAGCRLDMGLAERLARAAVLAHAGPETKIPLAWVLYLQEKGSEAEEVLDTLDASELAADGFFDGSILRAANLFWPLRRPSEALTVIGDAISLGDDAETIRCARSAPRWKWWPPNRPQRSGRLPPSIAVSSMTTTASSAMRRKRLRLAMSVV